MKKKTTLFLTLLRKYFFNSTKIVPFKLYHESSYIFIKLKVEPHPIHISHIYEYVKLKLVSM